MSAARHEHVGSLGFASRCWLLHESWGVCCAGISLVYTVTHACPPTSLGPCSLP